MRKDLRAKFIGAALILGGFLALSRAAFSEVAYTSFDLRDPFVSQLPKKPAKVVGTQEIPKEEVTPPVLSVASVVSGGMRPQAVIDGEILQIGDKIKDGIVVDITKEGVYILYQGETFLYLSPAKKLSPIEGEEDIIKLKKNPG